MFDLRPLGTCPALFGAGRGGHGACNRMPGKTGRVRSELLVADLTEHVRLGVMHYTETRLLANRKLVLSSDPLVSAPFTRTLNKTSVE